jgi:hypothetical protein
MRDARCAMGAAPRARLRHGSVHDTGRRDRRSRPRAGFRGTLTGARGRMADGQGICSDGGGRALAADEAGSAADGGGGARVRRMDGGAARRSNDALIQPLTELTRCDRAFAPRLPPRRLDRRRGGTSPSASEVTAPRPGPRLGPAARRCWPRGGATGRRCHPARGRGSRPPPPHRGRSGASRARPLRALRPR